MRGDRELTLCAHITFRNTRCNENAIEKDVKRKISENTANESTHTTKLHSTRLLCCRALGRTSEGRRAMCWVSDASSVRGGRSTRASHQSRPRSLPPPRTDASPKSPSSLGTKAQTTIGRTPAADRGSLRFLSPAHTHALSSSPLSREPAPAGATTGRLLMPLGLPTQVSVPTSTQLRTKCCESAAKRWICDTRGTRAGTHLWRTSVPRA
jgi:hypothetical protein